MSNCESKVNTVAGLNVTETVKLLKPVKTFTAHGKTLLRDLKDKRDFIQSQRACGDAREKIGTVSSGGKMLINDIIAKITTEAQDIARKEAQGIIDDLDTAVTAFNEQNCIDA